MIKLKVILPQGESARIIIEMVNEHRRYLISDTKQWWDICEDIYNNKVKEVLHEMYEMRQVDHLYPATYGDLAHQYFRDYAPNAPTPVKDRKIFAIFCFEKSKDAVYFKLKFSDYFDIQELDAESDQ